jgi:hypothetical protein
LGQMKDNKQREIETILSSSSQYFKKISNPSYKLYLVHCRFYNFIIRSMLKFLKNVVIISLQLFWWRFYSKCYLKTGYAAEDIKEFKNHAFKRSFYRFKQLFIEGKPRTKR